MVDTYFSGDPLWGGEGCGSQNTCCSQSNLLWFFYQMPLTNKESVEVRICYNQPYSDEAVVVKKVKLYVQ